jgi:predicted transcriptional regulator
VAYVYRPAVTRARITKSRLRSLIEQLYDGDAAPLVLQLMREQKFSPDEVAELQSLIERLDSTRKRSSSNP